jgi:hypothetical protein
MPVCLNNLQRLTTWRVPTGGALAYPVFWVFRMLGRSLFVPSSGVRLVYGVVMSMLSKRTSPPHPGLNASMPLTFVNGWDSPVDRPVHAVGLLLRSPLQTAWIGCVA